LAGGSLFEVGGFVAAGGLNERHLLNEVVDVFVGLVDQVSEARREGVAGYSMAVDVQ
jgi:hypothetical protein